MINAIIAHEKAEVNGRTIQIGRQKAVEFSIWVCYNAPNTQDSYIGNTTASQAVKAGSTPVSCSNKKTAFVE